jgi:hypothetical protein
VGKDDRNDTGGRQPGESEKERVDRELIELLNELRVVLPGVQVLFAFLLTVPFSNGFSRMTDAQRGWYFVAFITATISTILLIAPSTYHRIQFRMKDKERMLFTSNRLVIAGTVFLAASMGAAAFLITDVLFHVVAASVTASLILLGFLGLWYGLPIYRRIKANGDSAKGE